MSNIDKWNHVPETVSHTKNLSPIGFSLLKSKFHSLFFNSKSAKKTKIFPILMLIFVHRYWWRFMTMFMTNVGDGTCWWQLWDDGDRFITLKKSTTWRKSPILRFCDQHMTVAEKTYIAFDLEKLNSIVPSQIDIS